MKFGLSTKVIESINTVFGEEAKIETVIIFGSRAKGNFRPGSDIDLAIKGKYLTYKDTLKLIGKIDNLNLPYQIDLIDYSAITDKDVIEHINRVGIVFYVAPLPSRNR